MTDMHRIGIVAAVVLVVASLAAWGPSAVHGAPLPAAASGWPVLAKTSPRAGWSTPGYRAWYAKRVTAEQFSSPGGDRS